MIFEIIPNVGSILVCYHPIVPVERCKNLEDGSEKIKLAYFVDNKWSEIVVDKSLISSPQKIIELSNLGIAVTSENAKYLIKYLSEIENLNRDKIDVNFSVSRLGWFEGNLVPYEGNFEIDNKQNLPNVQDKFSQAGELKDWVEFFKERRKYNTVSRIVMASAVASILLKDLKQCGFTVHVYGESEYGKTVASMVAQSMFGNPSQTEGKGIGINFNMTNVGLEYSLNAYNNIPLFINEMQHQKDAIDYDKLLFLISEGRGRTRAVKTGGLSRENNWNNVAITNGEKNIIKENSNAGAYNRCLACELTDYSYEGLSEVADFVKENYGTVIREILKRLKNYNLKEIYKDKLASADGLPTTNKQKIIIALILTGDKILTDVIFKDGYYLTVKDFEINTTRKSDIVVEERAYEVVMDWYTSNKRHFLDADERLQEELKVDVYGKEMQGGFLAIIPSVLKKILEDNGYDKMEVLKAWKRKNYISYTGDKNTKTVRINGMVRKCIVLDITRDIDFEDFDEENVCLPF